VKKRSQAKYASTLFQIVEEILSRKFQHRQGLLAGYAFEPVEKILQRFTGGQGIKQVLDRHACAIKARRTADTIRVDPNQAEQGVPSLNLVAKEMLGRDRLDVLNEGSCSQYCQGETPLAYTTSVASDAALGQFSGDW
jgi:hypothetical protein